MPVRVDYSAANTNNTSSTTIDVPPGTIDGDFLLLFLECDGNNGYVAPAGFTQLYANTSVGSSHVNSVHYRVASSEPASYTINTASGNERGNVYLIAYRGVDTSSPIDNSSQNTGTDPSSASFTAMTPTTDNCAVVALLGTESGNNEDPYSSNWPTNFTKISDNTNGPPGTGSASSGAAFAESIQTTATACSGTVDMNTGNTGYITYFIALKAADTPTITSCPDIHLTSTNVTCSGFSFEASQGTGKLELADSNIYSSATKVTQTIDSWSDTSIQFDFVQGALSNNSTVYAFVTNDSGDTSYGFPITLGLLPYTDAVNSLVPGHFWKFQNNYTDSGFSKRGLSDIDQSVVGTGGSFTTGTLLCEDTTHSWQISSETDGRSLSSIDDVNNDSFERSFGGWFQLGGTQTSLSLIFKEGSVQTALALMIGLGNSVMAIMADDTTHPTNNIQCYSDLKLTPDRPYHLLIRFSYAETPKEFRLFIDGEEQSSTDGNPTSEVEFDTHSNAMTWNDPNGGYLKVGDQNSLFTGQEDAYWSMWTLFNSLDGTTNAGNYHNGSLNKTTQIRDILFRRGAIPKHTISSNTESNMQTQIDALASSVVADWPLGIRVEDSSTAGADLELTADDITFNSRCSVNLEWRGAGTLTYVLDNGSSVDSNKIFTPLGGTVNTVTATDVSVTCVDSSTGSAISGARVLMKAASGGDLPFEDSVTITSSGTTATVTHTSHGLRTGLKVLISGANESNYNGVFTITVSDANTYTYTMSGSTSSPATGTIKCTSVIIDDTTNGSGVASASPKHRHTTDQPVSIIARKGSASTYYKQGDGSADILVTGLSETVFMVKDE